MRALVSAGLALGLALLPATAHATARALPFTYNYETNAEGEGEIETYVNLVPVKAYSNNGGQQTALASEMQEEFEYGITNRLELGLYVTYAPVLQGFTNGGIVPSLLEGNGSKQRLRYRISDAGKLPVDIGLYGEVTENENEVELEAKIILQKRFGPFAIAANLVTEREFYFTGQADQILDPSAGFWFRSPPSSSPGSSGGCTRSGRTTRRRRRRPTRAAARSTWMTSSTSGRRCC